MTKLEPIHLLLLIAGILAIADFAAKRSLLAVAVLLVILFLLWDVIFK